MDVLHITMLDRNIFAEEQYVHLFCLQSTTGHVIFRCELHFFILHIPCNL